MVDSGTEHTTYLEVSITDVSHFDTTLDRLVSCMLVNTTMIFLTTLGRTVYTAELPCMIFPVSVSVKATKTVNTLGSYLTKTTNTIRQ